MGGRKVLSVCGGWQPGIPHLVKTSHMNTPHPSRPKSFNIEGKDNTNKNKNTNTESRSLEITALSKPI